MAGIQANYCTTEPLEKEMVDGLNQAGSLLLTWHKSSHSAQLSSDLCLTEDRDVYTLLLIHLKLLFCIRMDLGAPGPLLYQSAW